MPVKNTLTPKEAGRLIGRGQAAVEYGLRTRQLPFGTAVKGPTGRYSYIIPREAFFRWMSGELQETESQEV